MTYQNSSAVSQAFNDLILDDPQLRFAKLLCEQAKSRGHNLTEWEVGAYLREHVGLTTAFDGAQRTAKNRIVQTINHYITTNHKGRFKDTKPVGFVFEGTKHLASCWRDLLQRLCCLIFEDNLNTFCRITRIQGFRGQYAGRRFFGTECPAPERFWQIADSGFYVDVNLSANQSKELADAVHWYFGYGTSVEVTTLPCSVGSTYRR